MFMVSALWPVKINICPEAQETAAFTFAGVWIDRSVCQDFVQLVAVGLSVLKSDLMRCDGSAVCRVTVEPEEEERDVSFVMFSRLMTVFVKLHLDSQDSHHASRVMVLMYQMNFSYWLKRKSPFNVKQHLATVHSLFSYIHVELQRLFSLSVHAKEAKKHPQSPKSCLQTDIKLEEMLCWYDSWVLVLILKWYFFWYLTLRKFMFFFKTPFFASAPVDSHYIFGLSVCTYVHPVRSCECNISGTPGISSNVAQMTT